MAVRCRPGRHKYVIADPARLEAALRVAGDHSLYELLPPWARPDCALNAASRAFRAGADRALRARQNRLRALREEISQHTYVTLRNCTQPATRWFRIHGVRGDTVVLESLEMRVQKSRFDVVLLRLEEWEAKFDEYNDDINHRRQVCDMCWEEGMRMYDDML